MTDAREKARECAHRIMNNPAINKCWAFKTHIHSPNCDWAENIIATALQQARAEALEEAMRAVCHGCEEGLRFAPLPDDPALSVHWCDGESWGVCNAGPIRARHPAGWHVQVQKEPT